MNACRAPAGHLPNLPRTGNHAGPLAGLFAIVIVCAMIFLSLLSLARPTRCHCGRRPGRADRHGGEQMTPGELKVIILRMIGRGWDIPEIEDAARGLLRGLA